MEQRRRINYGALQARKKDLATWGYLRVIPGDVHRPNSYELLATGDGKGGSTLSSLHPDGWVHIPKALMVDARCRPHHVAVYAAIADGVTVLEEGSLAQWVVSGVGLKSLTPLSGCGIGTVKRCRSDLVHWHYLHYEAGGGTATSTYHLRPTPDVAELLQLEAVDDLTAGSPQDAGRQGGRPRGDPPESGNGGYSHEPPTVSTVNPPDAHEPGSTPLPPVHDVAPPDTHDGAISGRTNVHKERLNQICTNGGCDTSHWPLECTQFQNLRKATGQEAAIAAIAEVAFRIERGATIEQPYAFARMLAECYRDRAAHREDCSSDLHGTHAMDNHRAARLEAELAAQKARFAGISDERLQRLVDGIGRYGIPNDSEEHRGE